MVLRSPRSAKKKQSVEISGWGGGNLKKEGSIISRLVQSEREIKLIIGILKEKSTCYY